MILCLQRLKLGTMKNQTNENDKQKNGAFSGTAYPSIFQIRVKGQLDESWSDWLDGIEVKLMNTGEMVLSGQIRDQAELMGILNKLCGLNLTLLSVRNTNESKVD